MKYDLLLTGGEVIDPGAGLRGIMDVGVAGGKIVAVEVYFGWDLPHKAPVHGFIENDGQGHA